MKRSFVVRPDNGIVLLMDFEFGELPKTMANSSIAATDSCISIGTVHPIEGDVIVTLTDESPPSPDLTLMHFYEGDLKVASREISICSVANKKIASMGLEGNDCAVEIWANDPNEPDELYILATSR